MPRTLRGERLNDVVRETLLEVVVIGFCLPADQRIGPMRSTRAWFDSGAAPSICISTTFLHVASRSPP